MRKLLQAFPLLLLSLFVFAATASAHVVVYPKEAVQGSYEMFTLRVPTEKEAPTVKVEVQIPADVNVSRFEPKPGWRYDLTKDATGKITTVLWTATGEGLTSTEFGDFNMQGKVGDQAAQLVWKAIQTYKDGSVVEWTGAPDAKTPASVTIVKPKPAGASEADHHAGAAEDTHSANGASDGSDSSLPLILSIAALAVSLLTLLVTLSRRRKK